MQDCLSQIESVVINLIVHRCSNNATHCVITPNARITRSGVRIHPQNQVQKLGMKFFITEIHAIDPKDRRLKVWAGPQAIGEDQAEAQRYLDQNGFGYAKIIGELKEEITVNEELLKKLN